MNTSSFYTQFCICFLLLLSCKDTSIQQSHQNIGATVAVSDTTNVTKKPLLLEDHSILDRILAKPTIHSFATIVTASDWKDSLRLASKKWTVFAPSNEIVASLHWGDSLSVKEKNALVATYIIKGDFSTIAIAKSMRYRQGVYSVPNYGGGIFQFTRDNMEFLVKDTTGMYGLSLTDILAQNGLLHIMDTLRR